VNWFEFEGDLIEAVTAVTVEITAIWYVTPCSLIEKFTSVQTVRHHIAGDVSPQDVLHPSTYVTACGFMSVWWSQFAVRGSRNEDSGGGAHTVLQMRSWVLTYVSITMAISFMICIYCSDWLRGGVRVPVGQEFSLLHVVQTSSEVHSASYTIGTGGLFPGGVKRPGREADTSPPASAEVKKMWIYASTPPIRLLTWCLIS
jgi:hypothetical protein